MINYRTILIKYIFYILVFTSLQGYAEDKKPLQEGLQPSTPAKIHPLAENLAKMGAFSCAEKANQIGNFLGGDTAPDLIIHTPQDSPNNRLLMSTMIIHDSDKQVVAGSISMAPNQVNGCGASYHAVSFFGKACMSATAEKYPSLKFQSINKTDTQIAVINKSLWILAMPAGNGCIFIKEEILE